MTPLSLCSAGTWGQAVQCMFLSFSRKVKSLSGVGNTEFIKKALAGGATALAAVGGISSCPSQQPQLVQPLRRLRPAMPREAPWLGWSPLADQAETGHPRKPWGYPTLPEKKKAWSPRQPRDCPGPIFSKPLGGKRRSPAQGAAQSFSPSAGTGHVAWGLSSIRDHSESPQGTRDNADGTASQTLWSLKRHECQGLLPLLTPSPSPAQQAADGASPLTRPSLPGPGKGENSDPTPASSWGGQEQQH